MSRRAVFLEAADVALPLLALHRVAQRWSEPSALPKMSVGGLANHLAAQVVSVHAAVAAPVAATDSTPVTLLEHYSRAAWVEAGLDDEANVAIRSGAERSAQDGPHALLERVANARSVLQRWPSDAPAAVRMPWWDWSLTLDDFLLTRMMELMVHTDDLAVSIELPTPVFPRPVARPVLTLLTALAERRHGQPAVLRALTRRERAPDTLAVF